MVQLLKRNHQGQWCNGIKMLGPVKVFTYRSWQIPWHWTLDLAPSRLIIQPCSSESLRTHPPAPHVEKSSDIVYSWWSLWLHVSSGIPARSDYFSTLCLVHLIGLGTRSIWQLRLLKPTSSLTFRFQQLGSVDQAFFIILLWLIFYGHLALRVIPLWCYMVLSRTAAALQSNFNAFRSLYFIVHCLYKCILCF